MHLPEGVSYHPRQERLLALNELATIQIKTITPFSDNTTYHIEEYAFDKALAPYLRDDGTSWQLPQHREIYLGGQVNFSPVIYSAAEHRGQPRQPHITVIPNLTAQSPHAAQKVFGWLVGEGGASTADCIYAVYEFQSEGIIVLSGKERPVELWVARAGDKVPVPGGCNFALYNLGDEDHPLVTLHFPLPFTLPPQQDSPTPNRLPLHICRNEVEVIFTLNSPAANATAPRSAERTVKLARAARLSLGQLLVEKLAHDSGIIGQFARLGVNIKRATPEVCLPALPPDKGTRLYFARPLVEAVRRGTEVYRYFFANEPAEQPGAPTGKGIAAIAAEIAEAKARHVELTKLNRRLLVVVEGAGDWVENAYRTAFKKKVSQGENLSVFYADDTRWKPRPSWATPGAGKNGLQPWETYLDKSDPAQLAFCQHLRPDVVFVVTADFTHAAIAREWLGKSPLVFVEKPFDSNLDNVQELLRVLGQRRDTAILGLDHYQLYALPLHKLMKQVMTHLGGALARVDFYMTEDRPIEWQRDRSLQYGLTLDLLPHLLALLAFFGDVSTIDEIRILAAGQYAPLITADQAGARTQDISTSFFSETYARLAFTFQDYSGNGFRVPCQATVGKGFAQEVKYLEITGRSGNAIRLDLNKKPDSDLNPDYPWDSLFFLQGNPTVEPVFDPYQPTRELHILDKPKSRLARGRYEWLLDDLLKGTKEAVASTLLLTEALEIVRNLDRIWRATQDSKPWESHRLKELPPIQPLT